MALAEVVKGPFGWYHVRLAVVTGIGFFTDAYSVCLNNHEAEANSGCYEARRDWIKYIGPVEQFGGCNPVNGNFTAVVLPLCKPERLRMVAYILECKQSHLYLNPKH